MNKLVLLLVAIFATSAFAELSINASEMKLLWSSWKSLNNKVFAAGEEVKRFSVFVENYIKVASHNHQNADSKLALNQFADLTDEEFKAQYTSGLKRNPADKQQEIHSIDFSILALPESVDWREKGAVTGVKNQASCGSCWAFSATGALEGLNFIKSGKLLSFSEQQLVDCERPDEGCSGGFMNNAFAYTAEKGIETEEDYPYKGADGTCKYDANKAHKVNSDYKNVTSNNTDALKAAIAVQPVSVAVQADQAAFRFHKSGVIKANCGIDLNHGILAVGYTTVNGVEAFIVKNSWTTSWGTKGYGLIATDGKANNGAGVCGILIDNSYPTA